jgi:hypothetical protein
VPALPPTVHAQHCSTLSDDPLVGHLATHSADLLPTERDVRAAAVSGATMPARTTVPGTLPRAGINRIRDPGEPGYPDQADRLTLIS